MARLLSRWRYSKTNVNSYKITSFLEASIWLASHLGLTPARTHSPARTHTPTCQWWHYLLWYVPIVKSFYLILFNLIIYAFASTLHTCMHTCTLAPTCARTHSRSPTPILARTHARTHPHPFVHARSLALTCIHPRPLVHARTHAHSLAHTPCVFIGYDSQGGLCWHPVLFSFCGPFGLAT